MVLDAAYLKATVGTALSEGIAQAVTQYPADPVEFLGEYLIRHADAAAQAKAEAAEAERVAKLEVAHAEAADVKKKQAEKATMLRDFQHQQEADHFAEALGAADSLDTLYDSILEYIRSRLGANAYVALADRPERSGADAPSAEPEPAPPEGEGEEGAPGAEKPKHRPTSLWYVAATAGDVPLLLGKLLERVEPPAEDEEPVDEDDEEGAKPKIGVGEGVSFGAIDNAMKGVAPFALHLSAITNPSVKFWYTPRKGDYLCVPILDASGECIGILGVDNLGQPSHLTEADGQFVLELAQKLAEKWVGLEEARQAKEAAELQVMEEQFTKQQAELSTALESAGEDPLAVNKAKLSAARANLLALDKNKLAEIKGYRVVKPEVVRSVKAVFYTLGLAKRLPGWQKTKSYFDNKLPWGGELLEKIANFEPAKKKNPKPFARAMRRLDGLSDEDIKRSSFVAFLLATWARAANELFQEALKAREAAEAEGAPAADEIAPEDEPVEEEAEEEEEEAEED